MSIKSYLTSIAFKDLIADRLDRCRNERERQAIIDSLDAGTLSLVYAIYAKHSTMWPAGQRIREQIWRSLCDRQGKEVVPCELDEVAVANHNFRKVLLSHAKPKH